jgi:hypothetical protein
VEADGVNRRSFLSTLLAAPVAVKAVERPQMYRILEIRNVRLNGTIGALTPIGEPQWSAWDEPYGATLKIEPQ